ncbi:hypothetical protein JKF63_06502 [Porcisia hertigi]|uniref:RRM domain-containing protein n=1 Tax=Porcisia hertigi TaxID=2761500 RepID=A0A836IY24_9TRYP|nr:hypothetical protein JKF63_06502 [Porcisia hertigi]
MDRVLLLLLHDSVLALFFHPPAREGYWSSTNLFVRYLPREVDDNRLREIFSAFGNITSSMVMRDIHSGQSLGTAFVRYEKHEEALRALYDAQGMPLFGKTVSVQWAKQQHDSTPAGQDRLRMNKLFLRNVPLEVTKEELVDLVKSCGSVIKVTMHGDTTPVTDPAFCRRIVFITFAEPGAAEAALRAVHNTCAFHQCRGVPLMGKSSSLLIVFLPIIIIIVFIVYTYSSHSPLPLLCGGSLVVVCTILFLMDFSPSCKKRRAHFYSSVCPLFFSPLILSLCRSAPGNAGLLDRFDTTAARLPCPSLLLSPPTPPPHP